MEIPEEVLVTEWKETPPLKEPFTARERLELIIGATILAVALLGLAIWRGEFQWYIGACAVVVGVIAIFNEKKRVEHPRTISVTNQRIVIGNRECSLGDLAGFRLEHHDETVVVMLDHKRPALIPITLYYQNSDIDQAERDLSPVLPELPPKEDHLADLVQRFFKL